MELLGSHGEDDTGHTHAQSSSVIVWRGMSYHGTNQIHFCEQKINTNKKVYQRMLEEIVEPLQDTLFEGSDYCFQQDSAHAHRVKKCSCD